MTLIATIKTYEQVPRAESASRTPVELFKPVTKKDMEGIDREIPESIGIYSAENLTLEIANLTARLVELQEKLTAVNEALAAEPK